MGGQKSTNNGRVTRDLLKKGVIEGILGSCIPMTGGVAAEDAREPNTIKY